MTEEYTNNTNESGAVSIFSVIFFIILTSIITVGFIRLVNIEQRQAIDNSSSANALAAARSGVEDGKRVLLLAERLKNDTSIANAGLKSDLNTAIGSTDCDSVQGTNSIRNKLGLAADGKVYQDSGDGGQYYTCLTIDRFTADYRHEAQVGSSVIVPLKPEGGVFDQIIFSWHDNDYDGEPDPMVVFSGNPKYGNLIAKNMPSHMRLQLIKVPKTNLTPNSITSKTGYLGASTEGPARPVSLVLHDDADLTSTVTDLSRPTAICSTTDAYACSADVDFGEPSSDANFDYYLRVSALYRAAKFRVEMLSGASTVRFDGVQSVVDVTGKSGDTFRRIQARVSMTPYVDLPEYVAESTNNGANKGICKDMLIASDGHVSSTCWTP